MTLGRTTFIDEIIRKVESQASVGPKIIFEKCPTIIPSVTASPSTAHVEIHNENEGYEQIFQTTIHLSPEPSQEGNSCNLQEGDGETSGILETNITSPEPRSPKILVE